MATVKSMATAVDAMMRSCGPTAAPLDASSAPSRACTRATSRSKGTTGSVGEQAFDEALRARLLQPAFEPVETVQQLGRRDCRDRELVVECSRQRRFEIELAAFGRDEAARIDQDSHRFSGTVGLFSAVMPDSMAFR